MQSQCYQFTKWNYTHITRRVFHARLFYKQKQQIEKIDASFFVMSTYVDLFRSKTKIEKRKIWLKFWTPSICLFVLFNNLLIPFPSYFLYRATRFMASRHTHSIWCHCKYSIRRDLAQPQRCSWWQTKAVSILTTFIRLSPKWQCPLINKTHGSLRHYANESVCGNFNEKFFPEQMMS